MSYFLIDPDDLTHDKLFASRLSDAGIARDDFLKSVFASAKEVPPTQEVWLVGFYRKPTSAEPWEVVGIFTDKTRALSACKDWRYFVGPATLDVLNPEEATEWPGMYFPIEPSEDEQPIIPYEEDTYSPDPESYM